jgi:hypothetical protein
VFDRRVQAELEALGLELRRGRSGDWVISRGGRELGTVPPGNHIRVIFYLSGYKAGLEHGRKLSGATLGQAGCLSVR